MYKTLFATLLSITLCSCASAQTAGLGFYDDLSLLPFIYDNVQSHYLSSYDRTGGNDDGFRGTYSQLYIEDNGEHVIFDEDGPGCVYNFWFTGSGRKLHWGKLRIYIDGQEEPTFVSGDEALFEGSQPPFVEPLVASSFTASGGFSCSAPIPFKKHLKITSEKAVGFYNIYYQLYEGVDITSWTPRQDNRRLIDLFERCGSDPKRPNCNTDDERAKQARGKQLHVDRQSVVLAHATGRTNVEAELALLEGPGTIEYIKINPLFKPDTYTLNHTYLRIFYDGQKKPAVEVPIGPFFGSGLGEADVRGMFVGMSSSGTYYCYLPMPYRKGIRITLQNRSFDGGGEYFCQVAHSDQLPSSAAGTLGYFGASYNRAWPIVEEKDYVLFDFQGHGAVIGQVMTVEPIKPDRKRWWEGDLRIYIDGEDKPRFHGTGHEDEYQGGWSNFWLTNPYSLPLFGEPKTAGLTNIGGQINASTTAYRFWPGKIPFQQSIRISTEHGNHNDTPANYSSLVYYYFVP